MPTLAEINVDIDLALAGLHRARAIRNDYLISRSPWTVGQIFSERGISYQVSRLEAHAKSDNVVAWSHRFTKAGKAGKLVPIFSEEIK